MNPRDELTILKQAIEKSLQYGYLSTAAERVSGVDIILDPPSIAVTWESSRTDRSPLYLDPLFPLFERDWAVAFWGDDPVGDIYFGMLPSWKYHQHKLLDFVQNGEQGTFYKYIQMWL